MVVGVCRLTLHIPENRSLKGKRKVVKQLVERTRNRFSVAIAETDLMDSHSKAEIGITTVGNDRRVINSVLDKSADFVESLGTTMILDREIELISI